MSSSPRPAPFGRVLTAMVTPFRADGSLDLDVAQQLAVRLVDDGNDGLVLNGTTGEAPTTRGTEKAALLAGRRRGRGRPLRASSPGVGSNHTEHSEQMARDAVAAGAARRAGRHAVLQQAAAGRCHRARRGRRRRRGRTAGHALRHPRPLGHRRWRPTRSVRLAEHPQVVAMKDAKLDLEAASDRARPHRPRLVLRARTPTRCRCSPWAPSASSAPARTSTARGTADMVEAYLGGDVERARELHYALLPAYTGIFRTQGVILVKAGLRLTGLDAGPVRLPLVDATPEQVEVLRADLDSPESCHEVRPREPPAPRARRAAAPGRAAPCGSSPSAGSAEIGRNMTVFEHAGRLLVVDCGVLFPEEMQPGDRPHPPGLHLHPGPAGRRRGHRPHPRPRGPPRRGAVPAARAARHPARRVPLHPRAARGQAASEHRITPVQNDVAESRPARFGPFELEFFAVNHSIPDALAVAIKTEAGIVLHTGDFKMDQLPLDGRLTDLGGFARLGSEEGIDLLLSDSTNAEQPGFVTIEREIGPVIDDVIRTAQGRVVVASFASPRPPRADGARRRRTATAGTSPSSAARWCATWASPRTSATSPSRPACWSSCATSSSCPTTRSCSCRPGRRASRWRRCRAWRTARTTRSASTPRDTVILASSLIPGNENAVYRVINGLTRWGARVVHKGVAKVHVSGHASGRRAALPAQRHQAQATSCPCTASGATCAPTPSWACSPASRASGSCWPRTASWSTWSTARPRSSAPCSAATSTSTAPRSATSARRRSRTAGSSARRASSASTLAVDSMTGKVAGAPQISARGFSDDPARVRRRAAADRRRAGQGRRRRVTDARQLAQAVRRVLGQLGQRHLPPPPDDHPGGPGGLTVLLAALVLLVSGVGVPLFVSWVWRRVQAAGRRTDAQTAAASGTVVDVETRFRRTGAGVGQVALNHLVVRFTDAEGREVVFRNEFGRSGGPRTGATVPVRYDPAQPQSAVVVGQRLRGWGGLLARSSARRLTTLLVGVVLLVLALR